MDVSGDLFDSKFPKWLWIWFLARAHVRIIDLCESVSPFCPFTVWVLGWDSRHQLVSKCHQPLGHPASPCFIFAI